MKRFACIVILLVLTCSVAACTSPSAIVIATRIMPQGINPSFHGRVTVGCYTDTLFLEDDQGIWATGHDGQSALLISKLESQGFYSVAQEALDGYAAKYEERFAQIRNEHSTLNLRMVPLTSVSIAVASTKYAYALHSAAIVIDYGPLHSDIEMTLGKIAWIVCWDIDEKKERYRLEVTTQGESAFPPGDLITGYLGGVDLSDTAYVVNYIDHRIDVFNTEGFVNSYAFPTSEYMLYRTESCFDGVYIACDSVDTPDRTTTVTYYGLNVEPATKGPLSLPEGTYMEEGYGFNSGLSATCDTLYAMLRSSEQTFPMEMYVAIDKDLKISEIDFSTVRLDGELHSSQTFEEQLAVLTGTPPEHFHWGWGRTMKLVPWGDKCFALWCAKPDGTSLLLRLDMP